MARNPSNGFTLLEVLVALAFLAIAALAVMRASAENQNSLVDSDRMDTAVVLARSKLFELTCDGLNPTMSRSGDFEEDPRFSWTAYVNDYGWKQRYVAVVEVSWSGSDRTVRVQRIFED